METHKDDSAARNSVVAQAVGIVLFLLIGCGHERSDARSDTAIDDGDLRDSSLSDVPGPDVDSVRDTAVDRTGDLATEGDLDASADDDTTPDAPADATTSTNPVDESSCQGELRTDIAALFPPGGTHRYLGRSVAMWQERSCNMLTGCTPWTDYGSSFAGVGYEGNVDLRVVGDHFELTAEGSVRSKTPAVARCTVSGSSLSCDSHNYLGATDFISLSGQIRQRCVRLFGSDVSDVLAGDEYRLGIVVHFTP